MTTMATPETNSTSHGMMDRERERDKTRNGTTSFYLTPMHIEAHIKRYGIFGHIHGFAKIGIQLNMSNRVRQARQPSQNAEQTKKQSSSHWNLLQCLQLAQSVCAPLTEHTIECTGSVGPCLCAQATQRSVQVWKQQLDRSKIWDALTINRHEYTNWDNGMKNSCTNSLLARQQKEGFRVNYGS